MPDAVISEELEAFRLRARAWMAEHLAVLPPGASPRMGLARDEDERVIRARRIQRQLFEAGFAGICFPKQYAGQGLPGVYQAAFTEESLPYEMPLVLNVPTLSILAPTLLECADEEQKLRHIPAILRGEELWVQFLSEPTGGSDLAGAVTRASLDGDSWILNGSKIWSSNAQRADYALCLARTNWKVPKHEGLTMFIVPIRHPGVEVIPIRQVNGESDFCQEFFEDVRLPLSAVVGDVDDGWNVVSQLLAFERNATGGGTLYGSGASAARTVSSPQPDLIELSQSTGRNHDSYVRQLVAEAHVTSVVQGQLQRHLSAGTRSGALPAGSGSILRLFNALAAERRAEIGLELAGTASVVGQDDGGARRYGTSYLFRQAPSLAGGTKEIQRNLISERILGMPREPAADRGVPFDQVRANRPPTRR